MHIHRIFILKQEESGVSGVDTAAPQQQQRTVDENLEALASSLQTGITINTSASLASSATEPPRTEYVQSFMFGPTSTPLSAGTALGPVAPTYASVLSKGSLSPSMRNRHLSTGSSGGESLGSLSELMAKQQVRPTLISCVILFHTGFYWTRF